MPRVQDKRCQDPVFSHQPTAFHFLTSFVSNAASDQIRFILHDVGGPILRSSFYLTTTRIGRHLFSSLAIIHQHNSIDATTALSPVSPNSNFWKACLVIGTAVPAAMGLSVAMWSQGSVRRAGTIHARRALMKNPISRKRRQSTPSRYSMGMPTAHKSASIRHPTRKRDPMTTGTHSRTRRYPSSLSLWDPWQPSMSVTTPALGAQRRGAR